ncbi:unnamed protein product [Cyprideis torosa]|uniref:Uncharacterized protein n=1 Tax=Cyprideis torosa TaxID=163714 RepID=A0A7R8WNQ0_9CRUS|nr:unnamed protein product [Cyprideis torosa]CAG0900484.1 unnamed protein product [Cyprideis torosa]
MPFRPPTPRRTPLPIYRRRPHPRWGPLATGQTGQLHACKPYCIAFCLVLLIGLYHYYWTPPRSKIPSIQNSVSFAEHVRDVFIIPGEDSMKNQSKEILRTYNRKQTPLTKVLQNTFVKNEKCFFLDTMFLPPFEPPDGSYWMENMLSWKGLVVSPYVEEVFKFIRHERGTYRQLKMKRLADVIHSCLSKFPYPEWEVFKFIRHERGTYRQLKMKRLADVIHSCLSKFPYPEWMRYTYCLPFLTLLKAEGHTTIPLWFLDEEPDTLDILQTVPFHEVDINNYEHQPLEPDLHIFKKLPRGPNKYDEETCFKQDDYVK